MLAAQARTICSLCSQTLAGMLAGAPMLANLLAGSHQVLAGAPLLAKLLAGAHQVLAGAPLLAKLLADAHQVLAPTRLQNCLLVLTKCLHPHTCKTACWCSPNACTHTLARLRAGAPQVLVPTHTCKIACAHQVLAPTHLQNCLLVLTKCLHPHACKIACWCSPSACTHTLARLRVLTKCLHPHLLTCLQMLTKCLYPHNRKIADRCSQVLVTTAWTIHPQYYCMPSVPQGFALAGSNKEALAGFSKEESKSIFKQVDTDGGGSVELDEFEAWWIQSQREQRQQGAWTSLRPGGSNHRVNCYGLEAAGSFDQLEAWWIQSQREQRQQGAWTSLRPGGSSRRESSLRPGGSSRRENGCASAYFLS
eukprot:1161184-Pelagomonas_calceolata.AAC.2